MKHGVKTTTRQGTTKAPAMISFKLSTVRCIQLCTGWNSRPRSRPNRPTETGRMAKFYSLTRSGRKQLERELANWARLSTAINIVVQEP